ncbi:MAG: WbqC family protein [Muribaculaceae bacterium]|nr:WbqC family protein [Muribaculaceae bacterium]MDE6130531.1 WbqC family protein [Muribaculaceae bacterium]
MEKEIAILPPQLFGSTAYYATAARFGDTAVDYSMRADKRFKSAHRYKIVDTRGEICLTMPVCHLSGQRGWNDVELSDHGQWWKLHLTALESAYGRTPFFEFYIDRFLPLLTDPAESEYRTVGDIDRQADRLVRQILELPPALDMQDVPPEHTDLRRHDFDSMNVEKYWQIRADKLGFHPNLSILDMIFNIGPESALVIRK